MFNSKYHQSDAVELLNLIAEHTDTPPCSQWPDAFHPTHGESDVIRSAKTLCGECPVIAECAAYGIKWENYGIYGGLTPHERALLRGRQVAAGVTFDPDIQVKRRSRPLAG